MKYAIIVPFNYKRIKFDTIKSVTENTRPLLYYQLDLLINKLGFNKVFIIHNHENPSECVKTDFKNKYEFIHPLDLDYSQEQESLYYLKSFALAISRVPDSAKELYILGDNLLVDSIINFELMTYGNKCRFVALAESNLQRDLYDAEFNTAPSDNTLGLIKLHHYNEDVQHYKLLPAFIIKGSSLEFLKLKFSDNYGSGLFDNILSLSKGKDFKIYSIEFDDFREFNTFDDFVKFRLEM